MAFNGKEFWWPVYIHTWEKVQLHMARKERWVWEKKQRPKVFTYWHNSEVIPLMALNLQWCQPDSGRCLKMAETDEQEDGNRMLNKVRTEAYRRSVKIEQSPEPQFCSKSSKLLIAVLGWWSLQHLGSHSPAPLCIAHLMAEKNCTSSSTFC